ncbi:Rid family hydrolase [Massilia sp. CFBP9012]|uniref:Rid family hydrolase n=1 Tax=Massilia sp. CFBP9012 TaxID=3096531 RepID=UPI002A6A4DEF|nr:Rid family hydrolase [Massilia sp. CFBP9012]MDY0978301.1 Rid family hydrolase [Massilia sp. CFBP9012]
MPMQLRHQQFTPLFQQRKHLILRQHILLQQRTFNTDPEKQFASVMKVKSEIFPEAPYPNWTAVGVTWLAGLDFEIKVIARIPA